MWPYAADWTHSIRTDEGTAPGSIAFKGQRPSEAAHPSTTVSWELRFKMETESLDPQPKNKLSNAPSAQRDITISLPCERELAAYGPGALCTYLWA